MSNVTRYAGDTELTMEQLAEVYNLAEMIHETMTPAGLEDLLDPEGPMERLETTYMINREQAALLWYILMERRTETFNAYKLPRNEGYGERFLNMVREYMHQSFDGWAPEQQVIIRAFLADVTHSVHQEVQWEQEKAEREAERESYRRAELRAEQQRQEG